MGGFCGFVKDMLLFRTDEADRFHARQAAQRAERRAWKIEDQPENYDLWNHSIDYNPYGPRSNNLMSVRGPGSTHGSRSRHGSRSAHGADGERLGGQNNPYVRSIHQQSAMSSHRTPSIRQQSAVHAPHMQSFRDPRSRSVSRQSGTHHSHRQSSRPQSVTSGFRALSLRSQGVDGDVPRRPPASHQPAWRQNERGSRQPARFPSTIFGSHEDL